MFILSVVNLKTVCSLLVLCQIENSGSSETPRKEVLTYNWIDVQH